MPSYLQRHGAAASTPPPVHRPIPGRRDMVANTDGGGYVFEVDDFTRLRRWLILGSEGGTYYANETDHTVQAVDAVLAALHQDGPRAVALAREVSDRGLAKSNDEALYLLALAVTEGDVETKTAAYAALDDVARIGTHLFAFGEFVRSMRGIAKPHMRGGPGMRRAIDRWYNGKPAGKVAYQAVKYRDRFGFTHDDMLRIGHPEPSTPEHASVFEWIALPPEGSRTPTSGSLPPIIEGFLAAQASKSAAETARLAREYRLPREALLTEHLSDPGVNMAMLEAGMPMTALIRNLANMTRYGILDKGSEGEKIVRAALANPEAITKARVHPMAVLIALFVYAAGHSPYIAGRTPRTWDPNSNLIEALDEAFYLAFGNVPATGKRRLVAIDVSGSMAGSHVPGVPGMTPMHAAAAMAMVSVHADSDTTDVVAISSGLTLLPITKRNRLDDIGRMVTSLPFQRTDLSLPMAWAQAKAKSYDSFEVYTDNEVNAGAHPSAALAAYRRSLVRDARFVVGAMTGTRFSIADPRDAGMLDVVGMDASAPAMVSEFIAGRL